MHWNAPASLPTFALILTSTRKNTTIYEATLQFSDWVACIEGTLGVYELNNVDLLRDLFVWAYERSCQRYLAITQTMVAPDPLKIKYRETLIEAVQAVVNGQLKPQAHVISQIAHELAEGADCDAFIQILTDELRYLHEGNIARYKLRRSAFLAWHALVHAERD